MLVPLFVGVVTILFEHRVEPARAAEAHRTRHPSLEYLEGAGNARARSRRCSLLVILGWAIARDVGRSLGPPLFRRLEPATAGTVGFLIRLLTIVLALIVALRVAGIEAKTLALGGAFTAVILGLAAQQTLGNLIAGTVLLSARPFRVGERVRLQGGPLAGQIEGTVSSLGLLYTTFATGEDSIMVPNSVVLNVAVLPLREPEAVNLRARLRAGMTPGDLQELLERSLQTPIRDAPRITLEELDGEEVVVSIAATPRGRPRGASSRANCSRSSRGRRRARAPRRRSGGTGGSRCSQHAQQLQPRGRLELLAGDDPQCLALERIAACQLRRQRQEQLVDEPVGEQLGVQVRSPLAQQLLDGEAISQLREGAGKVELLASPRRARSRPGRAVAGGWRPRRSARRRALSAPRSSGRSSSAARGSPETMQASGSSLSPRSRRIARTRRVADDPPVALGAHRARRRR